LAAENLQQSAVSLECAPHAADNPNPVCNVKHFDLSQLRDRSQAFVLILPSIRICAASKNKAKAVGIILAETLPEQNSNNTDHGARWFVENLSSGFEISL
jgi:hypothetical protein